MAIAVELRETLQKSSKWMQIKWISVLRQNECTLIVCSAINKVFASFLCTRRNHYLLKCVSAIWFIDRLTFRLDSYGVVESMPRTAMLLTSSHSCSIQFIPVDAKLPYKANINSCVKFECDSLLGFQRESGDENVREAKTVSLYWRYLLQVPCFVCVSFLFYSYFSSISSDCLLFSQLTLANMCTLHGTCSVAVASMKQFIFVSLSRNWESPSQSTRALERSSCHVFTAFTLIAQSRPVLRASVRALAIFLDCQSNLHFSTCSAVFSRQSWSVKKFVFRQYCLLPWDKCVKRHQMASLCVAVHRKAD